MTGRTGPGKSGSRLLVARGILLWLFVISAGLAIYLYRADIVVTGLLVILASLFLGWFTFTLLLEQGVGLGQPKDDLSRGSGEETSESKATDLSETTC